MTAIEKTETERIQVEAKEYKGKDYVDVRIFFKSENGQDWLPTKKGITIGPGKLGRLIEALTAIKQGYEAEHK